MYLSVKGKGTDIFRLKIITFPWIYSTVLIHKLMVGSSVPHRRFAQYKMKYLPNLSPKVKTLFSEIHSLKYLYLHNLHDFRCKHKCYVEFCLNH